MRVLIDGFPRTGTTTLARLLAVHPDTRVIIEPFHPRRYGAIYWHRVRSSPKPVDFDFAWSKWNVIKHVWEPGSRWPFMDFTIQNDLWRSAGSIIALGRRNLARRYVSAQISLATQFWIGKREDFLLKLDSVSLLPIDLERALRQLQAERIAIEERIEALRQLPKEVIMLDYEDLFEVERYQQLSMISALIARIGFAPLPRRLLQQAAYRWLDPAENKWGSDAIYRRIPNWMEVHDTLQAHGYGALMGS